MYPISRPPTPIQSLRNSAHNCSGGAGGELLANKRSLRLDGSSLTETQLSLAISKNLEWEFVNFDKIEASKPERSSEKYFKWQMRLDITCGHIGQSSNQSPLKVNLVGLSGQNGFPEQQLRRSIGPR